MASRLTPRLKQLRKNLGMIPIDAKQRDDEDAALDRLVMEAEQEAQRLLKAMHEHDAKRTQATTRTTFDVVPRHG